MELLPEVPKLGNRDAVNAALRDAASKKGVVIEFSAQWCGPCCRFAPIYQSLQAEFKGQGVDFYKSDVDENLESLDDYNVGNLPLFVFIGPDGNVRGRYQGSSENEVRTMIEERLLG